MIKNIAPKAIIPLLALFIIAISAPDVSAQRRMASRRSGPALRIKSKRVIRRTAVVVLAAQAAVKDGKVYTGNLARAVAHQRFARSLWRRGMYLRAIHQSRRARVLALMAINANKGTVKADYNFDKEEQGYAKDSPADSQLDSDLDKEMPGYSTKDEDFINAVIDDVDLTDLD